MSSWEITSVTPKQSMYTRFSRAQHLQEQKVAANLHVNYHHAPFLVKNFPINKRPHRQAAEIILVIFDFRSKKRESMKMDP